MNINNYRYGDRVEFKIVDLKGTGIVVGVARNEMPVLGASYIIEPDESIRSDFYDYTHFVADETQLKKI